VARKWKGNGHKIVTNWSQNGLSLSQHGQMKRSKNEACKSMLKRKVNSSSRASRDGGGRGAGADLEFLKKAPIHTREPFDTGIIDVIYKPTSEIYYISVIEGFGEGRRSLC
jgi:hypothetical protein